MSRHQRTSDESSTRLQSSAVSTSVPTWGCSACCRPCSWHSSSSSSSIPKRWSHSASERVRRGAHPASTTTAVTNIVARAAAKRRATARGLGEGGVASPAVVEHEWHEPADQGHPGVGQRGDQLLVAVGQEAGGAELGGGDAEAAHLVEHAAGRQHHAPARHLAHAPRDRGPADSFRRDHDEHASEGPRAGLPPPNDRGTKLAGVLRMRSHPVHVGRGSRGHAESDHTFSRAPRRFDDRGRRRRSGVRHRDRHPGGDRRRE